MWAGRGGFGVRETQEGGSTPEGGAEQNREKRPEGNTYGGKARSTVVGFLNVLTGRLVRTARQRSRGEDIAAGVQALGEGRSRRPLIWDNAPPHQARVARAAAEALGIEIVKLPFGSPELNPLDVLWRSLKAVVAANRAYRSEEHTSELQSRQYLVCRLLLEKKKINTNLYYSCSIHYRSYSFLPLYTSHRQSYIPSRHFHSYFSHIRLPLLLTSHFSSLPLQL